MTIRKGRIVLQEQTIGFALCGSFCTHAKAMGALEDIRARWRNIVPIVSECTAATDTRFGTAHDLMREMERICDRRVISSIRDAEPIGPKQLLDLLGRCGRYSPQRDLEFINKLFTYCNHKPRFFCGICLCAPCTIK